jgi:beta-galactosidase
MPDNAENKIESICEEHPMATRNLMAWCLALIVASSTAMAQTAYVPPQTARQTFSFDPDWKFIRQDVKGAEDPAFDDSAWTTVSTPHSFNDVDSFRLIISHGGGDRGTYKGLSWYRKHFKIPAEYAGDKIFIEFEGMRQAGDIFLNGKEVGLYENGVTAYGLDISDAVHFGGDENVLAVKVDNRTNYQERATKTPFEWNANDFNPDHGGINRHVWLHITGKIYQTLPLYYGLESTGTYIYGINYDIAGKSVDVNVESEVQNSSGDRATVTLSEAIVDDAGQVRAKFDGDAVDMVNGEKTVLTATGPLKDARFWSTDDPYLYDVYSILTVDGKPVDVRKITTGFRKTEFKGGVGTGGVYINDKFVYLKGFSQRASDEWAGLGQAYPDWMHDLNAKLLKDCNGNYMRWMHISPQRVDVSSYDRFGIVEVCPAGDKERLVQGRQWDQRVEVMRDSMIYFRNSPSILFWEAGNTIVTPAEMQQMVDLRKQYDPNGGRVMGTRDNDDAAANSALTPICEYYGVMIGQDRRTDQLTKPTDIFRGYSIERRDRAPLIEAEDFRDEGARRFWDDYSPPFFGFKKGPADTWHWNSETFALAQITRYNAYWINRISNTDPAHSKWSGYASIYFTDSDADGRQDSSEVCRVSGKLDAVRLPKEIYFTERVMQNTQPDIHIIGHWTYPAGTKKTMNVVANCQTVQLKLNGQIIGASSKPTDGFLFAFPNVQWQPGTLEAVGMNGDQVVCHHVLKTAGEPKRIKLTPMVGPNGLQADGYDAALFDVEVVDDQGQRCPTDEGRIDFSVTGPCIWRGGYNSGKLNSTNNLYLDTECGINRVAVRSTFDAGTITLTASRPGLASDSVSVESHPIEIKDGLTSEVPQRLPRPQ